MAQSFEGTKFSESDRLPVKSDIVNGRQDDYKRKGRRYKYAKEIDIVSQNEDDYKYFDEN